MTSILSNTRVTRAKLIREKRWMELRSIDFWITGKVRCPECMALPGETCRTLEAVTPEPRSPHLARLKSYDSLTPPRR